MGPTNYLVSEVLSLAWEVCNSYEYVHAQIIATAKYMPQLRGYRQRACLPGLHAQHKRRSDPRQSLILAFII